MNNFLYKYEDLLELMKYENPVFKGNHDVELVEFKSIHDAQKNSISFIGEERKDKIELAKSSYAGCLLVDYSFLNQLDELNPLTLYIGVESPRETFVLLLNGIMNKSNSGIHETAVIHPEAKLGKNVSIGANCVIGKCIINDGTIIHSNVTILDNVDIGSNVIIWPGAVIGADGFGYLKTKRGMVNFPHIGGVVIEDEVHVGANTCIDKGALGNTFIGRGSKIDNLVHIAHNVIIGENSFVIANAMIGGSTKIGDDVWIAPSVSLRDGLNIHDKALIGMGSVVAKDVATSETVLGNPSRNIKEFKKLGSVLNKLIEE